MKKTTPHTLLIAFVIALTSCNQPPEPKMSPTVGELIQPFMASPGGYKIDIQVSDMGPTVSIDHKEPRKDNVWGAFGANLPRAKRGHTYKLSCMVSAKDAVMGLSVATERDWINRPYTDAGTYGPKPFEVIFTPKTDNVFYLFISEAPGKFTITDIKVEEL